jgi:hypothetical protein
LSGFPCGLSISNSLKIDFESSDRKHTDISVQIEWVLIP